MGACRSRTVGVPQATLFDGCNDFSISGIAGVHSKSRYPIWFLRITQPGLLATNVSFSCLNSCHRPDLGHRAVSFGIYSSIHHQFHLRTKETPVLTLPPCCIANLELSIVHAISLCYIFLDPVAQLLPASPSMGSRKHHPASFETRPLVETAHTFPQNVNRGVPYAR